MTAGVGTAQPAPGGKVAAFAGQPFAGAALAMAIGLLTLILYWPATANSFVNYDDPDYVTANYHVLRGLNWPNIVWAFTTGHADNWHPLTWLSLMLDVSLFGQQAFGMHLTNVIFHAANAMLVFCLLRLLTGATWRSACVAALFAWHPLRVESVAWISERKDVLCAFFGLLALIFYARYAQAATAAHQQPNGTPIAAKSSFSYALSLLCFTLGLLSKPMLVSWPVIMLILDFWPLGRLTIGSPPTRWWPLLREKIPFIVLAAAACGITIVAQRQAVAEAAVVPLSGRLENALISGCRYLGKTFWPVNLAAYYPLPIHWPLALVALAALFLVGISALAWLCRARLPSFGMGWLWYGAALLPVIGLVQVGGQALADRYTYIPSLGVWVALVWGAAAWARRQPAIIWPLSAAGLAALAFCIVLTRHQIGYWRDSETLFRHALELTSDNYVAHVCLGVALDEKGDTDGAIEHYLAARNILPRNPDVYANLGLVLAKKGRMDDAIASFHQALSLKQDDALAHYGLGNALMQQGRTEAAIGEYQAAIRVEPERAITRYNLGVALSKTGQTEAAIREWSAALALQPNDTNAHYNLGNAFAKLGQTDSAIAEYVATIHLDPANADAHNNLGNLLAKQGRTEDAIRELQEAHRLKPANADTCYNLGGALLKAKRVDEAAAQFQAAVRLNPGHAPSHYDLGVVLNQQGRADTAVKEFQEAIRLQPNYAMAHNAFGAALAARGQIDDAISQFQAALRLKPDFAAAQANLAAAQALKNQK